jgi:hypothetical protein
MSCLDVEIVQYYTTPPLYFSEGDELYWRLIMTHYCLHMVLALCISVSLLGGCSNTAFSLSITTTTPSGASEQLPIMVLKPDGSGPFPVAVIMHDCSGLGPASSGAPDR